MKGAPSLLLQVLFLLLIAIGAVGAVSPISGRSEVGFIQEWSTAAKIMNALGFDTPTTKPCHVARPSGRGVRGAPATSTWMKLSEPVISVTVTFSRIPLNRSRIAPRPVIWAWLGAQKTASSA